MIDSHHMLTYIFAVMCSPLVAPDNGDISNNNRTCGSQVTYSCREGYQLNGIESRTCLPTGNWTDNAPICEEEGKYDV